MSQLLLLGHHSTLVRRHSRGEGDIALPTLFPAPSDPAIRTRPQQDPAAPQGRHVRVPVWLLASLGRAAAALSGGTHDRETGRLESAPPGTPGPA